MPPHHELSMRIPLGLQLEAQAIALALRTAQMRLQVAEHRWEGRGSALPHPELPKGLEVTLEFGIVLGSRGRVRWEP
jgi:hypothetical protein